MFSNKNIKKNKTQTGGEPFLGPINPVVNPDVNPDVNPVVNPDVNPVVNPDVNPVVNPDVNPVVNPDVNPDAVNLEPNDNPIVNPPIINPDVNPVAVNLEPNDNPIVNPPIINPVINLVVNPVVNPPIINLESKENYPNSDYLYDKITSFNNTENNIKTYICAFTLDTHFVKYIVQRKDLSVSLPVFYFNVEQPLIGGENGLLLPEQPNVGDNESLDILFKQQVVNYVKKIYYQEASFLGYIPNISETNAVFVFVKIEALPPTNFIPCIPNELAFLNKVFNLDTDNTIKNLFANNRWLYVNESVSSPYSGYLCKTNENNQIVNVTKEELISKTNIDEIGTHFYFSFLPLDPQNAESLERFALFPMEYDCIVDIDNLNYYKQNMGLFENTNSFYVKGDLFSDKKEGHQFFIIKNTNQFTKIYGTLSQINSSTV